MTAQTFSVNDQNDIYLGADGNLVIVFNLQGTLQACEHAVTTLLGEMIYQADQGIPNFELIWVGVPNVQQYQAAVRAALLRVDGVVEIVSFIVGISDNKLNYTAIIRTIYGTGSING